MIKETDHMIIQKLILKDIAKQDIVEKQIDRNIFVQDTRTDTIYVRMTDAFFASEGICINEGGIIEFDTYINSFSSEKWYRYTIIEEITMKLEVKGQFDIVLMNAFEENGNVKKRKINSISVEASKRKIFEIPFGKLSQKGIIYPVLKAKSNDSILYGGSYVTTDIEPTQDVNMCIVICTYKREEYVKRNIYNLKQALINNPTSPCYEKVWIHISDNGLTLQEHIKNEKYISIKENKNAGGAGGFTRGIIECLHREAPKMTHVLLMDDDATINVSSVELNYILLSYLKKEYFDYIVGGKLLILDQPYLQQEVGATWNNGRIKPLKSKLDIRTSENVIKSEIEDISADYEAWFYCCIPMSKISKDNLPLPLFIHGDDIEYGLRIADRKHIYMNGICIWHEAFWGKFPGVVTYYDIRNYAILNAIYNNVGFNRMKLYYKVYITREMIGNIMMYRYQYVDLQHKAICDFCKGINWLREQDPVKLNNELFELNYKTNKLEQYRNKLGISENEMNERMKERMEKPSAIEMFFKLITINGLFLPAKNKVSVQSAANSLWYNYRAGKILSVDHSDNAILFKRNYKEVFRCLKLIKSSWKIMNKRFVKAAKEYREGWKTIANEEFWSQYLELEKYDR